MANDALRLWQEVIKELSSISKCPSERAPNQTKVLTTLLQQLNSTSSLPRATWKTLITEKKVPLKLLEACQDSSGSLAPVCQPFNSNWVAALSTFLSQAQQSGVVPEPDKETTSSLSLSIGQQLERAGLLQQLPAVITAAAQQLADLQDRPEAIAAGLLEPAADTSLEPSPEHQLSSIHAHLRQLLSVLQLLAPLWPQDKLKAKVYPVLVLPLMQLLVHLMQHVSLCLEQLPEALEEPPMSLVALLEGTCTVAACLTLPAALDVLNTDIRQQQQHRQQQLSSVRLELLQSPYPIQAVCLLSTIIAYTHMLQWQRGLQVTSQDNTCSSSSSSTIDTLLDSSSHSSMINEIVDSVISTSRSISNATPSTSKTTGPTGTSTGSSSSSSNSTTTAPSRSRTSSSSATAVGRRLAEAMMNKVVEKLTETVQQVASEVRAAPSRPQQLRDSWQLACSKHHLLPAVHVELLQALGCSSKAVLLAAAVTSHWGRVGRPSWGGLGMPISIGRVTDVYTLLVDLKQQVMDAGVGNTGRQEAHWLHDCEFMIKLTDSGFLWASTGQTEQQLQQRLQWSATEQKLHLLLPSVMLLNAAEPPSRDETAHVLMCCAAGLMGQAAVRGWRQQEDVLAASLACHVTPSEDNDSDSDSDSEALVQPPQASLHLCKGQQVPGATGTVQCHAMATQCSSGLSPEQLQLLRVSKQLTQTASDLQLVAAQVDEALHLSVRFILPELLKWCLADMAPSTSASSSSSNNNSSSSSSNHHKATGSNVSDSRQHSSSGRNTQASKQRSRNDCPHRTFQRVLNYICTLSDSLVGLVLLRAAELPNHSCARNSVTGCLLPQVQATASSIVAAARSDTAAWSQHAVQLCGTAESYVRLQAARPAGGSLALDDFGVALLCSRFIVDDLQWHNGGLLQAALSAGPGSPQQAHLFGLLCSLLKFSSQLPPKKVARLTDAVLAAALAAARILESAVVQQQQKQQQQGQPGAAAVTLVAATATYMSSEHVSNPAGAGRPQLTQLTQHHSSAPAGAPGDCTAGPANSAPAVNQPSGQHSAKDMLQWLVLFGRCCCIWAKQLQQGVGLEHPEGPGSAYMYYMQYSTLLDVFTQQVCTETDALSASTVLAEATAANASSTCGLAEDAGTGGSVGSTVAVSCLKACRAWLSEPSVAAQLSADAYSVGQLITRLDAALQAVFAVQQGPCVAAPEAAAEAGMLQPEAAVQAASAADIQQSAEAAVAAAEAGMRMFEENFAQLLQALCSVGETLSTLAISSACNSPTCTNISGPSEAGLVKGSSSTCGGCRVARYCCRACQTQHWKLHKPVCKALKAARAGGVP